MNKIYNNLNIENLIKTEWINQFNRSQQYEILEGLKKDLNISWYAKPEFNDFQMEEIRLGLEKGLDVSEYAKPSLDELIMKEIREELEDKKEYAI